MLRMERDWYSVAENLMALSGSAERTALIQKLQDSLKETQRLFASPPYFLGHDFSLVDITMAPLLWRLEQFGIDWTPETKILQEYAERIFQRPAFGRSLSGQEGTMRALSF